MIKPVGARCNLRCDYCYYRETNSAAAAGSAGTGGIGAGGCGTDSRVPGSVPAAQTAATSARIVSSTLNQLPSAPPALLTDQLLENLIRQYLAANPGPAVNFVWHGGEPSLAGLDFFRRVVQLQQKYLPTGWSCWNNLQTNGQLLNEEWCAWLAAQHFDVGLSIDGPQPSHDRYRRSADGRGSWAAAAAALRRLQQAGLQPDLLCTVNAANERAGLLTYQALRDFNTGWIEFIPVVNRTADSSVSAESVSAQGYGDFLCTVFTDWALHDLGRLDVQLFAELLRVQAGGVAGLCWLAPTCGRAVVVE
ncbi:MAG: radical SAM protein, partial [Actinomycetia bacterium]|nr:radical SAM protein [Actinomycetes bacterium]